MMESPLNGKIEDLAVSMLNRMPSQAPHDIAALSIAISLKRIADALDSANEGGRPQGSVLWWLETIASAASAGRS